MGRNQKKATKAAGILAGVVFLSLLRLRLAAKRKTKDSVDENQLSEKNLMEGKTVVFIVEESDSKNADGVRGHLEASGEVCKCPEEGFYRKYGKRAIDLVLSGFGIVIFAIPMLVIALLIRCSDPGPALFRQKRVGIHKKYFMLLKFRSMKMSTPHDIPTHQLNNPEQYLLKFGAFLRKYSLDELPQLFNIFRGEMSIIGPRPALWNQEDLVAERENYGANDVKPGLSGWAQINGRDELEIPVKAKLDGEYVKRMSFWFDCRCFFGTIGKVLQHDGVVEGGTGEIKRKKRKERKKEQ